MASAVFVVVLSFAPNPWVIAGLWILSAMSYAVAIPTEQGVVAEAAGVSLGRGMGIYESATLLGATVGAAAAGFLYQSGSGWRVACLAAAGVLLLAAVLVRPAVRAVGVAERPAQPRDAVDPEEDLETAEDVQDALDLTEDDWSPEDIVAEELLDDADDSPDERDAAAKNRREIRRWAEHLGLFVVGQVALAIFGHSFLLDTVRDGVPPGVEWWNWLFGNAREHTNLLMNAGRIWCVVFLVDTVWSWGAVLSRRSD